MILLIGGASHTGKTLLAQRMMERYRIPYLSMDHLKMGLIRAGYTTLTPMDDDKMTGYLWPVVRGMIKTAMENGQHMIVEGCYIPFDWRNDFSKDELAQMRYVCLVMSEGYVRAHADDIIRHGNAIEQRLDASVDTEWLIRDNQTALTACKEHHLPYLLIDEAYCVDWQPEGMEVFHN